MPRVLVMAERTVTSQEREDYLKSLAVRRDNAAAASVNFWVFESQEHGGRFLEFMEAATGELLRDAVGRLEANEALEAQRLEVWTEVKAPG